MLGGNAGRYCTSSTSSTFRIFGVAGFQNRVNDIVYCPPIFRPPCSNSKQQIEDDSTAVVYFGGDVQDFPESMETNRDSRGYMKYNLESSAILLRNAFPKSHIIIVRPVRMEFKTFSCFDNFVRGNNAGVPDHTPMNHALQHLEKLLQNLSQRLKSIPENEILAQIASTSLAQEHQQIQHQQQPQNNCVLSQDMDIDILQVQEGSITIESVQLSTNPESLGFPCTNREENSALTNNTNNSTVTLTEAQQNFNRNPLWWRENLNLDRSKLLLIGFSKGCVVLNQFIYEFHYLKTLTPDDSTMIRLLSRIKEMYWLDGGHGGQKNTWITSRSLLETLTRLGININVHVTPYQIQDDRRPWIRKEEKIFSDMLRRLGAPLTRHVHFDNTAANLVTHFEVLQAFCHMHIQQLQQIHIQQQQQQQQHLFQKNNSSCSTAVAENSSTTVEEK